MDPILYITESIPKDLIINRNNLGDMYTSTIPALNKIFDRVKLTLKIITPSINLTNYESNNSVCIQSKNNKVECCNTNKGNFCNLSEKQCNKEPKCYYKKYFSKNDMKSRFNVDYGKLVYDKLVKVCEKGVEIEFITEYSKNNKNQDESLIIQEMFPSQVGVYKLDMSKWYGRGNINTTIIIADNKDVYFSNIKLNWKDLTLNKGIGVLMLNSRNIVNDVMNYFNDLKAFTDSKYSGISVKDGIIDVDNDVITPIANILDKSINMTRKFPIWTELNDIKYTNPIDSNSDENVSNIEFPLKQTINDEIGYIHCSTSPEEAFSLKRTNCIDDIINTIKSADKFVYICLTDIIPGDKKLYTDNKQLKEIWWPKFFNAILYAVYQKSCDVRLLISYWPVSSNKQTIFMQLLNDLGNSCNITSKLTNGQGNTCGKINVRTIKINNWNKTPYGNNINKDKDFNPLFPNDSRVSLSKFVVTDKNFTLCSSDWLWGSFNNDISLCMTFTHSKLIDNIKTLFLTDWNELSSKNLISENQMKFITGETRFQNNIIESKNFKKSLKKIEGERYFNKVPSPRSIFSRVVPNKQSFHTELSPREYFTLVPINNKNISRCNSCLGNNLKQENNTEVSSHSRNHKKNTTNTFLKLLLIITVIILIYFTLNKS